MAIGETDSAAEVIAVAVPRPEPLDPWRVDRLRDDVAITPIGDLEELLTETAIVLEDQSDPERLERWCEGVARLCDLDVPQSRASALVRRARRSRPRQGGQTAAAGVATVVYHWLGGESPREIHGLWETVMGIHGLQIDAGPTAALNRRLIALARSAALGHGRPLLSAPTHRGGWIDPRSLAVRLAGSPVVEDDDLAQALLRLPPTDHARALSLLPATGSEALQALRAALGDRGVGAPEAMQLPATWDAVSVIRGDRVIMEAPLDGPRPWAPGTPSPTHVVTRRLSPVRVLTRAAPETTFPGDLNFRRWLSFACPRDLGPYFGYALAQWRLAERHPYWMSRGEREAIGPPLAAMLAVDTALGPLGYELLAIALGATTRDRLLATDVVIETITDRRLDTDQLGASIARELQSVDAVARRWGESLRDVAHVSPLHAHELQRLLETVLENLNDTHAPEARMVELLRLVAIDGDARVASPQARVRLEAVPRGSRAGRAAKEALAVAGNGAVRSVSAAKIAAESEARRAARRFR